MYECGAYVLYGSHGVCRVLGKEKQLVDRKRTEFLVLEPVSQNESRYYIPTQNPTAMAKIRNILSREEWDGLLDSAMICDDCWIREENIRKQHYRELIGSGERLSLLKMVCALYRYKDEQAAAGKKFHQCDDNFLRDAEKLLCSEIALVMDLQPEQAREFLRAKLR